MSDSTNPFVMPVELRVPAPTDAGDSYAGWDALRRAHLEFRSRYSADTSAPEERSAAIRDFQARVRRTGAVLHDAGERRAAQGILDYWSAELAGLPGAKSEDFVPQALVRPDGSAPASSVDSQAPHEEAPQIDERVRDIIRLSAAARLWRDSGQKQGFLVFGDAVEQAAKFRDADPDIGHLVDASEAYRKRKRLYWISGIGGALVSLALVLITIFAIIPYAADQAVATIKSDIPPGLNRGSVRSHRLWWLALLQPLRAPYDLSTERVVLDDIVAPMVRLYAPNFSRTRLHKVDFRGAELRFASFSEASITGPNDFSGAILARAQFRSANVAATSLVGADLYRAIFDRACLTDVNFTEANLSGTSFWGAAFNSGFDYARNFKNTAWWFADGWNPSQIRALTAVDHGNLSASPVFRDKMKYIAWLIDQAAPGSVDRADQLNDMAWTLATWGIDISRNAKAAAEPAPSCAGAGEQTGVPEDALSAASQAVCIMRTQKEAAAGKRTDTSPFAAKLATYEDSLAYILMQIPGRAQDAINLYEKDIIPALIQSQSRDLGETQFRYAVALNAIGSSAQAMAMLRESLGRQYLPTHEMQFLKGYVGEGAFRTELEAAIGKFWPAPTPDSCQSGPRD